MYIFGVREYRLSVALSQQKCKLILGITNIASDFLEARQFRPGYKYPKYNHPLNKTVNQFTKDGDFVASYMSFAEASRKTGIAQSGISSCCRGKYKQSGGYIWKCANQPDVTG